MGDLEVQRKKKQQPTNTPAPKSPSSQLAEAQSTLETTWQKLRTEIGGAKVTRKKKLAGVKKLPKPKLGFPRPPATRAPKTMAARLGRIERANEGKREGSDYTYESGAKGHTGDGIVPRLRATDGEIVVTAKFDGRDGLIMIDRKVSLPESFTTRWLMLRQSLVAEANGFRVRWEVPDPRQAKKVQRIISRLKLKNVDVAICK